jgi:tetratricopeptide (TPR) repeat protein
MGRPKEALAAIARALVLDPLNSLVQSFYAMDLVFARRFDEAIAAARQAPDNPVALSAAWWAYSLTRADREAAEAARTYLRLHGDRTVDESFDRGYAQGGYQEGMKRAAQALAARLRTAPVLPSDVAQLFLQAGETATAMDWLDRAFEYRDPNLPYLGLPIYDPLRADPRFQSLVRRMGLPQ